MAGETVKRINDFLSRIKKEYNQKINHFVDWYNRQKDKCLKFDNKMRSKNILFLIPYYFLRSIFIFVYGLAEVIVKVVYLLLIWIISMLVSLFLWFINIPFRIANWIKAIPDRWKNREGFKNYWKRQGKEWKIALKKDWLLYLIFLPVLVWIIIFLYFPKAGLIIAFKDYNVFKGIWDSPWAEMKGFYHFYSFFNNPYFFELISNTLMINVYSIIFIFPLPIILAIMLNEVRRKWFKETVQTIVFLPYFISTVVVVSIFLNFISYDGIVNDVLSSVFKMNRQHFILDSNAALVTYYAMGIYTGTGYNTLLYIAALTAIDPSLYEAGRMDGASKMQEIKYITIPGIMPTIVIMLVLRIGKLLNVGYETLILMYQPATYDKLDVLSTYIYRLGVQGNQQSYGAAVGIFNAVISLILVYTANKAAKKTGNSLW